MHAVNFAHRRFKSPWTRRRVDWRTGTDVSEELDSFIFRVQEVQEDWLDPEEYVIITVFHGNNGYANAPQYHVIRILPVLFMAVFIRSSLLFRRSWVFQCLGCHWPTSFPVFGSHFRVVSMIRFFPHICFVLNSHFMRAAKLPLNAGTGQLKCDGTRAETRFRLSAKRTSPFESAEASVQSTTGSRGVRISGSNAGYTMFHSPVSLSLPLQCVNVCHHIPTGVYPFMP